MAPSDTIVCSMTKCVFSIRHCESQNWCYFLHVVSSVDVPLCSFSSPFSLLLSHPLFILFFSCHMIVPNHSISSNIPQHTLRSDSYDNSLPPQIVSTSLYKFITDSHTFRPRNVDLCLPPFVDSDLRHMESHHDITHNTNESCSVHIIFNLIEALALILQHSHVATTRVVEFDVL